MSRILHVSEAWGGGIVTAIEWLVEQAPHHEHHLLFAPRVESARTPSSELFERVIEVTAGRRSFAKVARQMVAHAGYDIVHSHSSWAGAFVRLGTTTDAMQVYSPHCFAFERLDVHPLMRATFRQVEQRAVHNTDLLVANGRHEAQLAQALGHRHVVDLPMLGQPLQVPGIARPSERPRLAMLGRIAEQKDPDYFVRLIERVRRQVDVDAVWIGAPDPSHDADDLRQMGIEVTGWQDTAGVAAHLMASSHYIHSAAWEAGVPLAVLEAARQGLPVVCRANACLDWSGFPRAATLDEHVAMVVRSIVDPLERGRLVEQSRNALTNVERAAARVDLDGLYGASPVRVAA